MYYGRDNLLKSVVPRRRLKIRAGEVSKSLTVKNELIDLIKNKFHKMDGALGCITSQFFLFEF